MKPKFNCDEKLVLKCWSNRLSPVIMISVRPIGYQKPQFTGLFSLYQRVCSCMYD